MTEKWQTWLREVAKAYQGNGKMCKKHGKHGKETTAQLGKDACTLTPTDLVPPQVLDGPLQQRPTLGLTCIGPLL